MFLKYLLLSLFLFMSPAHAKDIDAKSKITAVTVFPDRAMITRRTDIKMTKGQHKVIFNNLPIKLDKNSIRVKGTGSAIIGSVENRRFSSKELVKEEERKLNEKLVALRDKNQQLDTEIQALNSQKRFIENIGRTMPSNINEDIKRNEIKPETWSKAWNAIGKGASETSLEILKKQREKRENNKEINKLQKDLNNIRTGNKDSLQVLVNIEAEKKGKVELELLYQIRGASWNPLYDARLETESSKLDLTQHGQVRQRTGEDWNDVKLTLSTARPSKGAQMPELDTWWINFAHERKYSRKKAEAIMPSAFRNMLADEEMDGFAPQKEIGFAGAMPAPQAAKIRRANVIASEFAAEFEIPGMSSVPADNAQHKFTIGVHKMDAKLTIKATPVVDTKAYLHTKSRYTGEAPLFAGQVTLYRDGAFIGRTNLKELRPEEDMKLSFGIDEKITISRRLLEGEKSEHGIISKEKQIERKYRTKVRNMHKMPVNIEVFDRVPVSKQEDITVEILKKFTTPGYKENYEDKTGVLVWDFEYSPSEEKNIDFGYTVSYPKDKRLTGM